VPPPEDQGNDWIEVTDSPLPVEGAVAWATVPSCGAVVTFCGVVRDHSDGRPGVTSLEYEVYPEAAEPRLAEVAASARRTWPSIGRLALLHRVGCLDVGETSVLVVASTPHRSEAFEAARFCIDTLKRTVPVWKRESWAGGIDWGLCTHDIEDVVP
jgi:molybdopterin synthase catalytic subunit